MIRLILFALIRYHACKQIGFPFLVGNHPAPAPEPDPLSFYILSAIFDIVVIGSAVSNFLIAFQERFSSWG